VVKKKTKSSRTAKAKSSTLLQRVTALEKDFASLRSNMTNLSEEVSTLSATIKHVDERTQRGEKLLMDMQISQRRTSRVVDRIAVFLKVGPGSEAEAQQFADLRSKHEVTDTELAEENKLLEEIDS